MLVLRAFWMTMFVETCLCFVPFNPFDKLTGSDPGEPLFLTPILEEGNVAKAKNLSLVTPNQTIESYSGYFTIDKKSNSNMFFWYFPSEKDPKTAPLILWLAGGPGIPSLYGVFNEQGPFTYTNKEGLSMRQYYWSQFFNVLYIDNPVGTGFSFTDSDSAYSTNEVEVANNLYETLRQFFLLFPELRKNDFYAAGESYGGKYVPAISYAIHEKNKFVEPSLTVNLKGLIIGNGLIDPLNMMAFGDRLYELGLIDSNGRALFKKHEEIIQKLITEEKYTDAFLEFDKLMSGDFVNDGTILHNLTGFDYFFNFLHHKDDTSSADFADFVQLNSIRRAIHVGNVTFSQTSKVEKILIDDIMRSVKDWFRVLVENYRVLLYSGQLDLEVPYTSTERFLNNFSWSGAEAYKTAPRTQWKVGQELAGYSKTAKGLTEVLVRNAGHLVICDQPKWMLDLVSRFVRGKKI